jgi:hypothetical protein
MSFPTTGILDNFQRANGGLGSNWTSPDTALVISSDTAIAGSGGVNASLWNASKFGPNCEVYVQFSTLPTYDAGLVILATDLSGSTGYYFDYSLGVLYTFGSWNSVGTITLSAFSVGDSLGIQVIGNVFSFYQKHSGVWSSSLGSITDSSNLFTGQTGYIGLCLYNDSVAYASFGGGTYAGGGGTDYYQDAWANQIEGIPLGHYKREIIPY